MGFASDLIQKVSTARQKVSSQLSDSAGQASEFIRQNPATSAATIAGTAAAGTLGITAIQIIKKKKSSKTKKTSKKSKTKKTSKRKKYGGHTKRGWKLDRAKRSKEKHELAYQRRKKKNKNTKKRVGKIYYTKNGQPYKILSSGKAKFIKGKRRKSKR